jgi:hypothetical protein
MQQYDMAQQAVAQSKRTRVEAAASAAVAAAAPASSRLPAQPATAADSQPATKRACVGQPEEGSTSSQCERVCRMQTAQLQPTQAQVQHLQQQKQQQQASSTSETFSIVVKDMLGLTGLEVTFYVSSPLQSNNSSVPQR